MPDPGKDNLAENVTKDTSGYYFNDPLITAAVREYQANGDLSVLVPHTKAFMDLINGVINTHGIWRFWQDRHELESEGYQTVLQCLARYEEGVGKSLFSYLSIAVKFRLRNWTRSENGRFILGVMGDEIENFSGDDEGTLFNESWGMIAAENQVHRTNYVRLEYNWGNNLRAHKICRTLEQVLSSGDVSDERDALRQTMKLANASQSQVTWVIEQLRQHGRALMA